jgi:hypothetical protein
MTRSHYAATAILLLVFGTVPAGSQSPPAPTGPLKVTTDTPEYCDSLASQFAAARSSRHSAQPEVEKLAQEGQHMCNTGLIRGGLARLRRALLMLRTAQ